MRSTVAGAAHDRLDGLILLRFCGRRDAVDRWCRKVRHAKRDLLQAALSGSPRHRTRHRRQVE